MSGVVLVYYLRFWFIYQFPNCARRRDAVRRRRVLRLHRQLVRIRTLAGVADPGLRPPANQAIPPAATARKCYFRHLEKRVG